MGSTTVNGVIKKVPYGLLRTINVELQPVSVVLIDSSGNIRDQIVDLNQQKAGIPFYTSEKIKLIYRAPSKSANAQVAELWRVHPTTGAETLDTAVSFSAVRQKTVNISITAINGSSGALTTSVTYDV